MPDIYTKDELKTIVIYHVTAENATVCVTKVGHINTLSIKRIKEKKEIEETEESYRSRFRKHVSGVQQTTDKLAYHDLVTYA